jgi:hypothetical protein
MSINNEAKKGEGQNKGAFKLLKTSIEATQMAGQLRNSLSNAPNDNSIFKQVRGNHNTVEGARNEESNNNHAQSLSQRRKYHSTYDVKALLKNKEVQEQNAPNKATEQVRQSRVDPETIEGKKVATVKDRARLRDLIKNI